MTTLIFTGLISTGRIKESKKSKFNEKSELKKVNLKK